MVNDGSDDHTATEALQAGARVISHSINLGVGAAIKTGLDYVLKRGAAQIVIMDGDGQHFPEDTERLLEALDAGFDLVIGSRFLQKNEIPTHRRWYNRIANVLTFMLSGIWQTDSQSGMRAFTPEFAQHMHFHSAGYEFCTEMAVLIRQQRIRWKEVPIQVRYTAETLSKGQSFRNGVKMVLRLLYRFF